MSKIFFSKDKNFRQDFLIFLGSRRNRDKKISAVVASIISRVRQEGDNALIDLTKKFDRSDLTKNGLFFSESEIEDSERLISRDDQTALNMAIERVMSYHKQQMPVNKCWSDDIGVQLGWIWKPIDRAGVYVPGGTASYPSSAIMNIVPAKIAGVNKITLCSPANEGKYNPMVLYVAKTLGVKNILKLGGAQAIAALAIGTASIKKVDKVTGPGNAFVSEAKRQMIGEVGIDSLAGPSEVVIICDRFFPPKLAAIDLLSQAEHDEKAQAILITNDEQYARIVLTEAELFIRNLKRKDIARKSWRNFGAIIIVPNFSVGIEISNEIAPEHLQLCFRDAKKKIDAIRNAGSIFVGKWSPEAFGDYITGSNHVLPTNGAAKFSSSLSVFDFLKRISVTTVQKKGFDILAPHTIRLANSEGLEAHAMSISERFKTIKKQV